jgi:hypothetical protein
VGGGPETASDVADTIMQKFWDSALALELPEEETDSHRYHRLSMLPSFFFWFPQTLCLSEIIALCSEMSLLMPSEVGDGRSSNYPPAVGNSCAFKLQDEKGRIHRFTCGRC